MKTTLKLLTFCCITLLFCHCDSSSDMATTAKPNIILILADDLGYGELGCYGQSKIKTPYIDQLAKEGMTFSQFYSAQTVCAPARCSLLTGLHQGHAQIRDNSAHLRTLFSTKYKVQDGFPSQYPLKKGTTTIAHLLKQQGYATGCVGKWGLGHPSNSGAPNKMGFDFYYGYICQVQAHNYYPRYLWRNNTKEKIEGNNRKSTGKHYANDLMEEECLKFIKHHKDQPFFLYYATPIPHLALQVPEDSLNGYKGKWEEEKPYNGRRGYLAHEYPLSAYAAMVTRMDRGIGRIMKLLDTLKLTDNTLIMFTSDNGPSYLGGYDRHFFDGTKGLRGHKGNLYEGGIRVPLVVRWPNKIKAGTESDHIAAFWDFMPTFCEVALYTHDIQTDGISFLPTLQGQKTQKKHDHLYWEFYSKGGWQVIRQGNWKAIRKNIHKGNFSIELYNLKNDPNETNNVAAQHPKIVKSLEDLMKKSRTPNPLFPFTTLGDKKGF